MVSKATYSHTDRVPPQAWVRYKAKENNEIFKHNERSSMSTALSLNSSQINI